MADPTGPGVVEGTENDDVIDSGYTDTDGDSVSGGADLVFGLGGDDTIEAGSGNDTIHGDSGSGEVSVQKVLDFNDLAAGTIVTDQYSGVSIYSCDQHNNPTMIFDSANPTGGDTDLAKVLISDFPKTEKGTLLHRTFKLCARGLPLAIMDSRKNLVGVADPKAVFEQIATEDGGPGAATYGKTPEGLAEEIRA